MRQKVSDPGFPISKGLKKFSHRLVFKFTTFIDPVGKQISTGIGIVDVEDTGKLSTNTNDVVKLSRNFTGFFKDSLVLWFLIEGFAIVSDSPV